MRSIPHERNGYSVDVGAGIVHKRYPAHGDVRPRVRDMRGVRAYLQGDDGRPCERCWPPAVEPAPVKRARGRVRIENFDAGGEPITTLAGLVEALQAPTRPAVDPDPAVAAASSDEAALGTASSADRPATEQPAVEDPDAQ